MHGDSRRLRIVRRSKRLDPLAVAVLETRKRDDGERHVVGQVTCRPNRPWKTMLPIIRADSEDRLDSELLVIGKLGCRGKLRSLAEREAESHVCLAARRQPDFVVDEDSFRPYRRPFDSPLVIVAEICLD